MARFVILFEGLMVSLVSVATLSPIEERASVPVDLGLLYIVMEAMADLHHVDAVIR